MLKIQNTLSKLKEEFIPIKEKKVHMFVCGPTVYDYSHVGHAKTYIFFDVAAKYLRFRGFDVYYLQNITDIDNKIIERAGEQNVSPSDLAKEYTKAYFEDMGHLGITGVSKYANATEYIKDIVHQIKVLKDKDVAYFIPNDGYYFDLSKFSDYGKLSGRNTESAEDGVSRIDESVSKKNKGDFALWKISKPNEPAWETELGKGRPGWHIEDTAITEHHFGPQYDLHGGARDLIFPHHEAEIAQQESASGKVPFVKYWLHTGFLTVDGQKMSKSLGNFVTIRDCLAKYTPEALRMLVLSAHYRSPIDFSDKIMKQNEAAADRISEFVHKLSLSDSKEPEDISEEVAAAREKFIENMEDDFNTPGALSALFDLIRKANPLLSKGKINHNGAKQILSFVEDVSDILGVVRRTEREIPDDVIKISENREKMRSEKNWTEADKLRGEIKKLGWEIEDTVHGPLIIKS